MSTTNPSATSPFGPVRRVRAFEEIAEQIRAQLRQGRFLPGQKLASERELCEQFQVSRNTLREALRSLENAGVLQSRKGASGGAFVMQVDGSAVITGLSDMYQMKSIKPAELIQARIWLESSVIRAAAENVTPELLEGLARNVADAEEAAKDGDFEKRVQINLDFHRLLAKATRNEVIVLLLEALLQATHQVIRSVGPYDNSFIPRARRQFIKLLAAGETEKAIKEMDKQLTRMQKIYFSKLDSADPPSAA
ncbi:MAG: GntR family transcriptional regulator [Pseudomonadota bacterium]